MRIFGRQDSILIIILTVAVLVIFARPVSRLFDAAREVEQTYGLALIPALLILTVGFVMYQQSKRQEFKAAVATSAAVASEAQARAQDLERLVTLGQALARSLDVESIRDVLLQHLPQLAGTSEVWVLIRSGSTWQALIGATPEGRREVDSRRERMADQAMAFERARHSDDEGLEWEGQVCFPMVAGGAAIGVLGLPETVKLSESQRRILAAASALVAVSVKNAQLFRETRENSLRDGLTGCFNKTHGLEVIDTELRRARRSKLPVSVIMFDIDHFKDVNDRYGHLCGDMVLSTVGRRMNSVLRGSDMKCRYGGEEFLVVLPDTPMGGAKRVAEILRSEMAETPVHWNDEQVPITASFGVTAALPGEVDTAVVIARADAALYRAKAEGRNCVRVSADVVPVS